MTYFQHEQTRELTAKDYVYQIKRLAHPQLQSPIYGLMSEKIIGLSKLHDQLKAAYELRLKYTNEYDFIDLRRFELSGVKALGRYR